MDGRAAGGNLHWNRLLNRLSVMFLFSISTQNFAIEIGVKANQPTTLLPLWSPVHALLISGTLDSNTPPSEAEQLLWGLPNAEYVSVKNGFHETLPSPAVQTIVVEFLGGKDAVRTGVELPPPSFAMSGRETPPATANH